MVRNAPLALAFALFASLFVSQTAAAATWSVEADCKEGDWTVVVLLAGFGPVDASCVDGAETRVLVDVGDVAVTDASIEATSSAGTLCDLPSGGDFKLALECASKTGDSAGLEVEDELEVEVELEEAEEEEDEDEEEEDEEEEVA